MLCSVPNTEVFRPFILSSKHTKNRERPTETTRYFTNSEDTYGRQLFTSVLRTFSTELGGKSFEELGVF